MLLYIHDETQQNDSSCYGKVAQRIEHVIWCLGGHVQQCSFWSFKPVVVSSNLTLPTLYERVAQLAEQRKNKQYV